ncbi:hypothetical protein TNCV_1913281 [Trichonephila clavipes]|nr:hypothetical protein TNCV_1913281 [Trichonephila clavipes]
MLPLMQRSTGGNFQQDNAGHHTARMSQDCLRTVTTLPWPADRQVRINGLASRVEFIMDRDLGGPLNRGENIFVDEDLAWASVS